MTSLAWCDAAPTSAGNVTQPFAIDPYLDWALRTQASYRAPLRSSSQSPPPPVDDYPLPFMVEKSAQMNDAQRRRYDAMFQHSMNGRDGNDRYDTGFVARADIGTLRDLTKEGALNRFQLASVRGTAPPKPTLGTLARQNTSLHTLGVIDDGCCLAHRRYWTSADSGSPSRFLMVWDQRTTSSPSAPWKRYRSGSSQDLVNYGEELSGKDIAKLLTTWQAKAPGLEPEASFYAAINRTEWTRAGRSHGAGVLHLLTGSNTDDADSTKPIIFVQLPRPTVADAAGGSLGMHVLDGARYIVQRTREQAGRQGTWKTSINISLGSIAGPHDGTTITEMALDELVDRHGAEQVQITMAAGNTSGRRIHAQAQLPPGGCSVFSVMVPPAQSAESYVEFWFEAHAIEHLSLLIQPPHGPGSTEWAIGTAGELVTEGNVVASLIAPKRVAQGNNGTMALLALRGTSTTDNAAPAPYGVWNIEVRSTAASETVVHAWVERNETIVGQRHGQRTHFVANDSVTLTDTHTLSSLAHGSSVHVVGSYTRLTKKQTADCARGPIIGGLSNKPDFMAPSNESPWTRGIRIPGFFSGSTTRLSGTSAATPQYARVRAKGTPPGVFIDIETPDGIRPGVP